MRGREKCADGRVAEANPGALAPLSDDQCAAASATCTCPRRRAAGACQRKGALFGLYSEGELFGHAIALDHGQGDYTVEAVEDCLLWHMAAEDLARVMAAQPSVAHFLTAAPGERLRAAGSRSTGTLADLRLRLPVSGAPDLAISECAALMARHQVSCLPVLDREGLVGILTDRDLRTRVLARGVDPSRPVAEVMTRSPLSVPAEARIDDALVEMLRLGIHHLPVLDPERRLVGVVSAGDLLRLQAPHPLRLVRDIQRASGRQELVELARQGPGLLAALTRQGSAVTEVGRIASLITDACTRRLIELAQMTLGEAPMGWAWLSFGSQARMEQGLISDQDNGLLLVEAPDPQAAEYFLRLAESVCDGLDACGYAHCPGGVMAKGRWRLPLADWRPHGSPRRGVAEALSTRRGRIEKHCRHRANAARR